jgi:hypothetical protein
MGRGFTVKGKFYHPLVPAVLAWIREHLRKSGVRPSAESDSVTVS